MDIKNCRECGALFNYLSGPRMCPECKRKLEEKFMEVRDFVRDNPISSIAHIAEEMNVSVQQINQWIREERLIFSEDSEVKVNCESCGRAILTGRFCENCKAQVANELGQVYRRDEPQVTTRKKDGEKMRFLDQD